PLHPFQLPVSRNRSTSKSSLPAPTVSNIRLPPSGPPANWFPSFRVRDCRQDVEPARLLSARWWPVEDEFQGSKIWRVGRAAGGRAEWLGAIAAAGDGCESAVE